MKNDVNNYCIKSDFVLTFNLVENCTQMSLIIIINTGSSSVKLAIYQSNISATPQILLKLELKKNNDGSGTLFQDEKFLDFDTWENKLEFLFDHLRQESIQVSNHDVFIHRMVHGWDETRPIIEVDNEFLTKFKSISADIAPLHNPQALQVIELIKEMFGNDIKQYVCFDTTFGESIPKENYIYALPEKYSEKIGIRKYLFHGISYKYIVEKLKERGGYESKNIVICHLGSGSSVCAIKYLQPVDSSFGFSPTENLVTSTRVGEFDVDAYRYLKKIMNLSDNEMSIILSQESGLLALSGSISDMKTLIKLYDTDQHARLAVDIYIQTVVKYIFQMIASLQSIDVLIFTGGIGEQSEFIRAKIVSRLTIFQVYLSSIKNKKLPQFHNIFCISKNYSKVEILLMKTDESQQMLNEYLSVI